MADSTVYPEPADHPEAKQFISTLAENPDPLHRLMFSDWLEDNGYANAAAGQRWASKHNKAPNILTESNRTSWGVNGWQLPRRESHFVGVPRWGHHVSFAVPHTTEKNYLPEAFSDFQHTITNTPYGDRPLVIPTHPVLTDHTSTDPAVHESNFLNATNQLHWDDEGEPHATEDQRNNQNTLMARRKKDAETAKYRQARLDEAAAKRQRIRDNEAKTPRLF